MHPGARTGRSRIDYQAAHQGDCIANLRDGFVFEWRYPFQDDFPCIWKGHAQVTCVKPERKEKENS